MTENTQLAAEMAEKGLVRAQILTLKGNKVWRWVKPDNPNIVGEVIAATKAVVKAVKEVVKPAEPRMFTTLEFPGCCGAQILDPVPEPTTERDWEAEYAKSTWSQYYKTYKDNADAYEKQGSKVNAQYYRDHAENYSLEAFIKKDGNTGGGAPHDGSKAGYGIMTSSAPFPKSSKSPAGIFYRKDRDPVNEAKDDYFDAAAVVDFDKIKKTTVFTRNYCIPYGPMYGNGAFTVLVGASGGTELPHILWSAIWKGKATDKYNSYNSRTAGTEPFKPGDVVVFIANNSQRNSDGKKVPKLLAEAGFTEVVRTGNRNHPGTSTIYLYERKLTEADLAYKDKW